MKRISDGYKLVLAVLWSFLKSLFALVELFLELASGKRERGRRIDCFNRPEVRPRPDPYIYSQYWLYSRGIAFTWDNPDFAIVDPADGTAKAPGSLAPSTAYRVDANIHNGSIMPAIATRIDFTLLRFGAGTASLGYLGFAVIDVPALGSATASVNWTTTSAGGHACLQAWISHPDDANPLNNLGQHNTHVAAPAGARQRLAFHIGNPTDRPRLIRLEANGYRLPETPLAPPVPDRADGTRGDGRRSLDYLRRLQQANSFERSPVAAALQAQLETDELLVAPGSEVETFIEMLPAPEGGGRQAVNVNVFLDEMLVGGVTAYVEET